MMHRGVEYEISVGKKRATIVLDVFMIFSGGKSKVKMFPSNKDDPKRRRPSIERAKKVLNWEPKVYAIVKSNYIGVFVY